MFSRKRSASPPSSPELVCRSKIRAIDPASVSRSSEICPPPGKFDPESLSPAQVLRRELNRKLAAVFGVYLGTNQVTFDATLLEYEDREKVRDALAECNDEISWEVWLFAAQEVCIRDDRVADYVTKKSSHKVSVPQIDYATFMSVLEDPRNSRLGSLKQIPTWILGVQVDELAMLDKIFAPGSSQHYHAHAVRKVLDDVVVSTFGGYPDLYERSTKAVAHHVHESIKFAFKYPRAVWLTQADYHAEFFGTVDHESDEGKHLIEHMCAYFGIYGDMAFTFAAAMRDHYYAVWKREQEMERE